MFTKTSPSFIEFERRNKEVISMTNLMDGPLRAGEFGLSICAIVPGTSLISSKCIAIFNVIFLVDKLNSSKEFIRTGNFDYLHRKMCWAWVRHIALPVSNRMQEKNSLCRGLPQFQVQFFNVILLVD